jgi:mono/diheme cytochrome c family protein
VLFCIGIGLMLGGCDRLAALVPDDMTSRQDHARTERQARTVRGGDAERGRRLIASGQHGCAACHAIPGVRAPRGVVGPPLHGIANRSLIAGRLPNEPGVLIAFIANAPALAPETGMPALPLSDAEARDVAAFLYTLQAGDAWGGRR